MSSGFTFGANAKPGEAPAFGQTPVFGSQQPGGLPFSAPAANAGTLPQFAPAFGGGTSAGGFQFPAATATSGSTFATPTFNFNPPATQSTLKPPGVAFGTPSATSNTNTGATFGTPLTSESHNLFGTATSSVPSTGLTFGTSKPTIPGMGLSFNTQVLAAPTTVPTFGTSVSTMPVSSTGLMYSTSTTPGSGLGFSIPPATKPGPTFSSSVAPTGLSFGTSVPLSSGPGMGLTFGAPPVTSSTTPAFGTSVLPSATTSNFTIPASSAPATGLSFNAAKPTSGLGFGTPTSLNFGVSSLAAPSSGPTFGTSTTANSGLLFATSAPSTTAPAINFVTPTTTRTTAATMATTTPAISSTSTSIGFGSNLVSSATTTSAGLPLDLGGSTLPKLPAGTTSAGFNLLPQPPATTATSTPQRSVGLGGISATPPKQPPTTTNITTEQVEVAPRNQVLPNELFQTVENFKKFVQEQKSFSSEISRFSVKELKKVESDIDLVNKCISEMENELQKNKAIAEKLKYDTAKGLQHVEMAQRTFDTPSGLQYDNTAPLNYFIELCDNFEKDMYTLKVHIENIDKCVRNTGPPLALTSQDLALGMRRLHETFVALAGRLQSVHSQVEFQKEQYLNLRKQMLNDYTNVFESRSKELEALEVALDSVSYQPPTVFTGPTPFSSLGNSQAQALAHNPPPTYPATTPLGASAPGFNTAGSNTASFFGSNITGTSMFNPSSTAFQLQKPPIGNKRGKP